VIDIESMSVEGDTVELERVYLVADGDNVSVGKPTVDGAKVIADVVDEGRGKKVLVFKYKPKVRYRRKKGHRQPYTRLAIKEIVAG
jgi:large subunit ribosomal protein L21